ncbi:MAG: LysM peptidoglycan-binding domain-containing protein [Eubacteriales bacterium]|nr:LysM peptidoglycan-binding domain-containing protein [Eubacteriales bacterium]
MKNKRFLSMVLCMVLVASLFTGFVSTASADDVLSYPVKDGDYLFKICKAHGLDYYQCKNAIMILNNFTTEIQLNRLTVGQVVKLPASNAVAATVKATSSTTTTVTTSTTVGGTTTTTTSTSTVSGNLSNYNVAFYLIPHVVQYGETLASICNTYGTSYGQYASMILGMNSISNANNVWAGKTIYVPSTKAPTGGGFYAVVNHVVSSGETMTSICNNYGTSYAANATLINGLNSKTNLNTIYAGQSLYIPVVSSVINTAPSSSSASTQSGYAINLKYSSTEGLPYATLSDKTVTRADAGKGIKIIGGAKAGYALKSINVTRADNNANVVTNGTSFTMPPCDVNVEVVYSKGFLITRNVVHLNSGTFETMVNDEAVERACYGDNVVLKFYPKTGYSAQLVKYTFNGSTTTLKQNSDGTYSFKMPNYDVTVDVTFEETPLFPINSKFIDYYYFNASGDYSHTLTDAGSISYKVDGVSNTKAAKNTQVVATVTAKNNYGLSNVIVVKAGADPSVAANRLAVTKKDNTYSFKMPDNASGVDVYAMYSRTYALSTAKPSTNGNGGSIYFSSSDTENKKITRASAGQTVYIVANPNSGFALSSTPSDTKATYAKGASSTPVSLVTGDTHISFVMPPNDVTVTPAWVTGNNVFAIAKSVKDGDITIKVKDSYGTFNNASKAFSGDTVRFYLSPKAGYILDTVTTTPSVTPTPGTDSSGDYQEFTMPSEKVTIKVTFKVDGQAIDISGSSAVMSNGAEAPKVRAVVNGVETDNARVGYTMTADFKIPDGYEYQKDSNEKPMVYIARWTGLSHTDELLTANSGKYTYKLRETDVSYDKVNFLIMLTPTKVDTSYTILKNSSDYKISVAGTVEPSPLQAYEEQKITVTNAKTGYKIKSVKAFTGDAGSPTYLTVNTETDGEVYSFIMPNKAVTTEVEFAEVKTVAVSSNDSSLITYSTPATGVAGEMVSVVITFNDPTTYKPGSVSANGSELSYTDYTYDEASGTLTVTYTVKEDTNNVYVNIVTV